MPLDIALAYDAENRRCDVVFDGRDFVLDRTWQTPVLMSLGCDRRAHADDALPQTYEAQGDGEGLRNARRGWSGDALDPRGELTGSRQWVFARSKLDEGVRRSALAADIEALDWLDRRLGVALTVQVDRLAANTLAHKITIGSQTFIVPQVVG